MFPLANRCDLIYLIVFYTRQTLSAVRCSGNSMGGFNSACTCGTVLHSVVPAVAGSWISPG